MSKGNNKKGNKSIAHMTFSPVRWCSYNREAKRLLNKFTIRIDSKRLSSQNVITLIDKINHYASAVSHRDYSQILIYNDKYSDSINIRIIIDETKKTLDNNSVGLNFVRLINQLLSEFDGIKNNCIHDKLYINNNCMDAINTFCKLKRKSNFDELNKQQKDELIYYLNEKGYG
jgi:hypothetical protein